MKNPFSIGERIYLRPAELDDAPLFQQWINDPEVNQFLGAFMPVNGVREKEFLEGLYKEPGNAVLVIALKDGDRPIGSCGLHQLRMDFPNRSAELGILIGDKEHQDRGYGSEAMRLLCAYGFGRLNLHRIGLRVYEYNRRAIRCYEKAGFRVEGAVREGRYFNGAYYDVVLMGLLAREFRGEREGAPVAASCQEEVR
jgi:RimJ/RimL family protein N-acetyltransferase